MVIGERRAKKTGGLLRRRGSGQDCWALVIQTTSRAVSQRNAARDIAFWEGPRLGEP